MAGYSNTLRGDDRAKRNAADFARNACTGRDFKAERMADALLLTDAGWEKYCKETAGNNHYSVMGKKRRRMERMKQISVEGYKEMLHWREIDIATETAKGDDVAVSRMRRNWADQDAVLTELAALVGIQYPPEVAA